jgi:hypothetical protein
VVRLSDRLQAVRRKHPSARRDDAIFLDHCIVPVVW